MKLWTGGLQRKRVSQNVLRCLKTILLQNMRLKVHMHEIFSSFFPFFWHHSIIDKAKVQNVKCFLNLSVKFSLILGFLRFPRYRRKRTVSRRVSAKRLRFPPRFRRKCCVSLRVFGENAAFPSAFSAKTLCFTPHIRRKCIIPLFL